MDIMIKYVALKNKYDKLLHKYYELINLIDEDFWEMIDSE